MHGYTAVHRGKRLHNYVNILCLRGNLKYNVVYKEAALKAHHNSFNARSILVRKEFLSSFVNEIVQRISFTVIIFNAKLQRRASRVLNLNVEYLHNEFLSRDLLVFRGILED